MTIIHTYSSNNNMIHVFSVMRKKHSRYIFRAPYLLLNGVAKTTILISIFIAAFVGLWLFVFCSKLSLDYKISLLKNNIKQEEEKINYLHESLAQNISDDKIMAWAKNNGFVPITAIKYVKIDTPNLAQANIQSIK